MGAANLSDVAASEGPFTLFAPTNDAFAKVPNYDTDCGDCDDDDHDDDDHDDLDDDDDDPDDGLSPTNDAFAKIPEEVLAELLADPEALSVILLR